MLRLALYLALLSSFACGVTQSDTDPVATTEAPLATGAACSTFDQDAERGAGTEQPVPAPQPSGSSACVSFVVLCAPLPDDAGAQFDPATCSLHFSPDTCRALGLTDGTTISDPHGLKVLLAARREPKNAWEICAAVHEVTHGEDNQAGGWERGCTTEINAFRASRDCLKSFYDRFCSDCRSPSYAGAATCASIAASVRQHEAGFAFNTCICVGPVHSPPTCAACTNACKTSGADRDVCDQLARLYCE